MIIKSALSGALANAVDASHMALLAFVVSFASDLGLLCCKLWCFLIDHLTDLFTSAPFITILLRIARFTYLGFTRFSCIGGGNAIVLVPACLLIPAFMMNSFCSQTRRVVICMRDRVLF